LHLPCSPICHRVCFVAYAVGEAPVAYLRYRFLNATDLPTAAAAGASFVVLLERFLVLKEYRRKGKFGATLLQATLIRIGQILASRNMTGGRICMFVPAQPTGPETAPDVRHVLANCEMQVGAGGGVVVDPTGFFPSNVPVLEFYMDGDRIAAAAIQMMQQQQQAAAAASSTAATGAHPR
jgi:hypothetical protein